MFCLGVTRISFLILYSLIHSIDFNKPGNGLELESAILIRPLKAQIFLISSPGAAESCLEDRLESWFILINWGPNRKGPYLSHLTTQRQQASKSSNAKTSPTVGDESEERRRIRGNLSRHRSRNHVMKKIKLNVSCPSWSSVLEGEAEFWDYHAL